MDYYEDKLSTLSQGSPPEFYKCVKAVRPRDKSYLPTIVISDKDSSPLNAESKIKERGFK